MMLTLEEIGMINYIANLAEQISREVFGVVLSEMDGNIDE